MPEKNTLQLKDIREYLGLSLQEMADYLGMERTHLFYVENAKRKFPPAFLANFVAVAEAFNQCSGSKDVQPEVQRWLNSIDAKQKEDFEKKLDEAHQEWQLLQRKLTRMQKEYAIALRALNTFSYAANHPGELSPTKKGVLEVWMNRQRTVIEKCSIQNQEVLKVKIAGCETTIRQWNDRLGRKFDTILDSFSLLAQ